MCPDRGVATALDPSSDRGARHGRHRCLPPPAGPPDGRPSSSRRRCSPRAGEHSAAGIALAVAWAGLAIVFGVYAIVARSVGAVVLMLGVLAILRGAWTRSWYEEEPRSLTMERQIHLLP